MLTVKDILTSSGKYPEREHHPEVTDTVLANIQLLLSSVNPILDELGIKNVKVSSGFRPSSVNAKIPNAAKKSAHMRGLAVDLEDPTGEIDKMLISHPDVLRQYKAMVEDPAQTKGWAHIDIVERKDRPSRVFIP